MQIHGLLPLVLFVVLVGIAVVVFKVVIGFCFSWAKFPYQKAPFLFTVAERSFLGVLELALENRYRVFGKVRLADVIRVKSGLSGGVWQSAFNRIQSKHVDFVVCDRNDLSIKFVIELDDLSHVQLRMQVRDDFFDKALDAAAVPVFHFIVKRAYAVDEIKAVIFKPEK